MTMIASGSPACRRSSSRSCVAVMAYDRPWLPSFVAISSLGHGDDRHVSDENAARGFEDADGKKGEVGTRCQGGMMRMASCTFAVLRAPPPLLRV